MKDKFLFPLLLFVLLLINTSCSKDDVEPANEQDLLKDVVLDVMTNWYLWNEEIADKTSNVNLNDFVTGQALLAHLKYQPLDKFSNIINKEAFEQSLLQGQSTVAIHGFSSRFDNDGKLFVIYVYADSPAEQVGLERGTEILSINGVSVSEGVDFGENEEGVSNTFEIKKTSGEIETIDIGKQIIETNSVLHYEVKTVGTNKVGYLVFNRFQGTSEDELNIAFDFFQTEGVTELVLDLRYNGGGLVGVAQYLASIIAPTSAQGDLFVKLAFNNIQSAEQDQEVPFINTNYNFNFNRLFVLTQGGSASASELVIIGLRPYIPVYVIGGKTLGKPVGSSILSNDNLPYVINAITFRNVNKDGFTDYFDGLTVDSEHTDSPIVPWGNINDPSLADALFFIANGTFDPTLLVEDNSQTKSLNQQLRKSDLFEEQPGMYLMSK